MSISSAYYEWLVERVYDDTYSKNRSYNKLLKRLHTFAFRWSIPHDENRAKDGLELRHTFEYETGRKYDEEGGQCSVLEMMIALSSRCEDQFMWDPDRGDRAGLWFWTMIVNLGLGGMTDDYFDDGYVQEVVERFLSREYWPDGTGGLFVVQNPKEDMRNVEIWDQMNWHLDELIRQDW